MKKGILSASPILKTPRKRIESNRKKKKVVLNWGKVILVAKDSKQVERKRGAGKKEKDGQGKGLNNVSTKLELDKKVNGR